MSTLERIREFLTTSGASFRELHHEPTATSEASAQARGEDLSIGGKALLIKVHKEFRLFVLSASMKVDNSKIRARFETRKTRFATRDELVEMTGLVPGSVPPFGEPILSFPLYVDPSVLENNRIAFNAGSLTDSVFLDIEDYTRLARPEVFKFAE